MAKKLEFSLKDVAERFGDRKYYETGANNIQDEIAVYLLRSFREVEVTIPELWKAAEYIKESLDEDYIIINRKFNS